MTGLMEVAKSITGQIDGVALNLHCSGLARGSCPNIDNPRCLHHSTGPPQADHAVLRQQLGQVSRVLWPVMDADGLLSLRRLR